MRVFVCVCVWGGGASAPNAPYADATESHDTNAYIQLHPHNTKCMHIQHTHTDTHQKLLHVVYTLLFLQARTHARKHTHTCAHTFMHTHTCTHMHAHTHAHTHTYNARTLKNSIGHAARVQCLAPYSLANSNCVKVQSIIGCEGC